MSLSSIGAPRLNPLTAHTTAIRDRMGNLQRQLGTGSKAQTYAEVGGDRALGIAFRQRLAELEGLQSSVSLVTTRLEIVDQYLNRLRDVPQEIRQQINPAEFELNGGNQTIAQKSAESSLREMLDILNQDINGRHLFAGADIDQRPVASHDQVMSGEGSLDGFSTVLSERKRADLGADDRGRLTASNPTALTFQLDETANNIYGFKLAGISGDLAGATFSDSIVAFPAASSVSVELTGQPVAGEHVTVSLALPTGEVRSITLVASSSAQTSEEFTIGSTTADSFANLEAALLQQIETLAVTDLAADSAMHAADDFFNTATTGYPVRVGGTPETATASRDGSADTVSWYLGTNNSGDPRQDILGRVDSGMVVGYGMRANEDGFRSVIENLAVFAAEEFGSSSDEQARYRQLAGFVQENLSTPPVSETIESIHGDIAAVYKAAEKAEERHATMEVVLADFIQRIEGVDNEQAAVEILALQTSIEASYRATSILMNLTLADYI